MTIAHASATGVTTATGARGTSSTTVAYTGVSAGRMAVIFASVKPSTASWSAVSGWTNIADVTGGTGAAGADVGTTRLGVWYRILDGSESGSVTVGTTGGGSVTAVMHVVSKTRASWSTPVVVSGSDTGHGTNFSATMGSWSKALSGGDWVLVGHSSDTDNTGAISAPTLTQTGATFGTVTARNRLGNSDGDDNIVTSWSASVSTGTANAPTFGFTWAASSCGPAVAVRLHEYDPISSLVDNFDDNSIANPPWSGNYGTNSETGGRARVNCITTYSGYQTGYAYSWDGETSAQLATAPALGGAATECYAAMWVVDPTQGAGNDVGFNLDRITGKLRFMSRTSFSEPGAPEVTINTTTYAWWRLRTTGGNLLWETSSDGIAWSSQRSIAQPSWLVNSQDLKMLLECHRDSGTPDFAEWDNVGIVLHVADAALAVTATLAATGRVTDLAAAALTATASLSASASSTKPAAATLAVTASLTTAATDTKPAAAALAVTASITATAVPTRPASAALAVTAALAATGAHQALPAAALAVTASLSAAAARSAAASAALAATATLTAAATGVRPAAAALSATATFAATTARQALPTSALAVTALLTTAAAGTRPAIAALAVTATLDATAALGAAPLIAAAALAVTATLSATGARTAQSAAALTVTAVLTAGAARTARPAIALAVTVSLTAGPSLARTTSAALAVLATLAAAATVNPVAGGITQRPSSSTTTRPSAGIELRRSTDTTTRPVGATTARPYAEITPRP